MQRSQVETKHKRKTLALKSLIVLAVAIFLDGISTVAFLAYANSFVSDEIPRLSDRSAVVVFWGGSGYSGGETKRRMSKAIQLYQDKQVARIICVGGARPQREFYGSVIMRAALIDAGIPEGAIFHETRSKDTHSNLKEAVNISDTEGIESLCLATSPVHMLRVKKIAAKLIRSQEYFLCPYDPSTQPEITLGEMWSAVHHEWAAYGLYAILPEKFYRKLINWLRR